MFALEGSSPSSCIPFSFTRFFSLAMEPKKQYPILLGESIKEEEKQKLLLRCFFWMRA